jgi:hypothetical protein
MNRKKLKNILLNFYSPAGADLILRGERKPKYEIVVELHKKHKVPFDIWLDIKSFIKNDTKNDKETSSVTA